MLSELMSQYSKGGMFMHFITACSAIGIGIAFERFLVLMSAGSVKKEELLNRINAQVLHGDIKKAIATSSQVKSPLTNIIKSGLTAVANGGGSEEVQTAMDAVALREVPKIEKRIGLLATLSNIATLLGLLGTVSGLIGAFSAVSNVAPAEKASALANAIAVSMNTTAYGLIVAIPLLGAFGYLSSKAQGIIDDIHESSVATLNFILANKGKITK